MEISKNLRDIRDYGIILGASTVFMLNWLTFEEYMKVPAYEMILNTPLNTYVVMCQEEWGEHLGSLAGYLTYPGAYIGAAWHNSQIGEQPDKYIPSPQTGSL